MTQTWPRAYKVLNTVVSLKYWQFNKSRWFHSSAKIRSFGLCPVLEGSVNVMSLNNEPGGYRVNTEPNYYIVLILTSPNIGLWPPITTLFHPLKLDPFKQTLNKTMQRESFLQTKLHSFTRHSFGLFSNQDLWQREMEKAESYNWLHVFPPSKNLIHAFKFNENIFHFLNPKPYFSTSTWSK